ncbi:MAG: hypothetical protein LC768_08625, partial [Acidobacteria bacterium]|nr:hypothetical protein [Acidobacteriota bacterium]
MQKISLPIIGINTNNPAKDSPTYKQCQLVSASTKQRRKTMKLHNTTKNLFSTALFLAMLLCALPIIAAAQEKIAFGSERDGNREIYLMNADGTNQSRLTNSPDNDGCPSFSDDGSKIAFQSNRDGNYEIYVMNADGSNQINLSNNPGHDTQPSWGVQANADGDDDGAPDETDNCPAISNPDQLDT